MFKIGISDRLSLEVLPSFAHVWNYQTSVTGMGDLPVEFEYRFNNENNETGFPSVTASVGVSFPIGDYEHLQAPLDGLSSGAYTLKQELLLQSLFYTPGQHPLRLRLYGVAFESVTNVPVLDMSVYGTEEGFVVHAAPGVAAVVSLGACTAGPKMGTCFRCRAELCPWHTNTWHRRPEQFRALKRGRHCRNCAGAGG